MSAHTAPASTKTVGTSHIIDEVSRLTHAAIYRSAVLQRLFDLMASNRGKDGRLTCDFGGYHDYEFWRGLRELTDKTIEDQERIAALVDGLSE